VPPSELALIHLERSSTLAQLFLDRLPLFPQNLTLFPQRFTLFPQNFALFPQSLAIFRERCDLILGLLMLLLCSRALALQI